MIGEKNDLKKWNTTITSCIQHPLQSKTKQTLVNLILITMKKPNCILGVYYLRIEHIVY